MSHERPEFDITNCQQHVCLGDEAAARALFDHFYPLVARIVRAHRTLRDDESDLIQEVFMRVFKNLHRFRGAAPLEHWIARIASNVCRTRSRTWRRRPELRFADLSEGQLAALERPPGDEISSPMDDRNDRDLLERMLQQLPPADRALIVLLDLEERSLADAACLLGTNRGALAVRAFRARNRLKKIWNQLNRMPS
jgi:RNA polymerase sigma-70 factor (ECF subfamily)